jgi:hypothetical protein
MTTDTTLLNTWLAHPYRLDQKEQEQVQQLINAYPYFLPAQWMRLSQLFNTSGFSPDMLQQAHLYKGTWSHLYATLQAAQHEPMEQTAFSQALDEEETSLDDLIQPVYTENYFQHQGFEISDALPDIAAQEEKEHEDPKSLMLMMGFDEWLLLLKKKNDAKKSEEEDKAFLRSMWQREKLAAAIGEEDDNIPEAVFEMAINSIDRQDIMVSESLAEIHVKQGHFDKAIEIYRKLSLQNPEKKTYFAAKINHLNKEKLS